MMEKEGRPAVEVVLTVLHAGGKFGDGGGYKVSGGLHGVGVSVVNALSEQLHVEVRRDGHVWTPGLRARRAAGRRSSRASRPTRPARSITFLPDAEIFETLDFEFATLEQRLRETAFLTRGLRISIDRRARRGQRRPSSTTRAASRTSSRYLNENKDADPGRRSSSSRPRATRARSRSRCSGTPPTRSRSSRFANNINTHEGGSHLSGFRSALTRTLNRYAREKGDLKEKDDDARPARTCARA